MPFPHPPPPVSFGMGQPPAALHLHQGVVVAAAVPPPPRVCLPQTPTVPPTRDRVTRARQELWWAARGVSRGPGMSIAGGAGRRKDRGCRRLVSRRGCTPDRNARTAACLHPFANAHRATCAPCRSLCSTVCTFVSPRDSLKNLRRRAPPSFPCPRFVSPHLPPTRR